MQGSTNPQSYGLKVYYFVYFTIIAAFLPFLPIYLRSKGVSGVEIGTVIGLGSLVMVVAQPLWGMASDHFRAPVRALQVTLFCCMLLVLLFLLSTKFWWLCLVMIVYMFFQSPNTPLADSIVLATLKNSREGFGSVRLWGSLGFSVAVLVMGKVFTGAGIKYIFYCISGLSLASLLATLWLPSTSSTLPRAQIGKLAWQLLRNPLFFTFVCFTCLVQMTFTAYNTFFSLYFTSLGGSSTQLGTAWMIAAVSEIPLFYLGERLRNRFGTLKLLRFAAAAYGVRWIIYSFLSTPEAVLVTQLLQGLSFGIFYLAAVQHVSALAPPQLMTTGQSLFGAVTFGIGSTLGSFIGGVLYQYLGLIGMFRSLALITFFALLLFTVSNYVFNPHGHKPGLG